MYTSGFVRFAPELTTEWHWHVMLYETHVCSKGKYVSPRLCAIVWCAQPKSKLKTPMVSMADAAGDSFELPLLAIPFKGEPFDSPLKHSKPWLKNEHQWVPQLFTYNHGPFRWIIDLQWTKKYEDMNQSSYCYSRGYNMMELAIWWFDRKWGI